MTLISLARLISSQQQPPPLDSAPVGTYHRHCGFCYCLAWTTTLPPRPPSPAPGKKKEGWKPSQDEDNTIGILYFDVANAMYRAVNLYRSLFDSEIARLRSQILASPAIRLLVSTNKPYLLALALAEKLDDLNRVTAVTSRLDRCCSHPALLGFEHVYSDLLAGRIDPTGLGSLSKDMDDTVHKMEGFFASSGTAVFASPTSSL